MTMILSAISLGSSQSDAFAQTQTTASELDKLGAFLGHWDTDGEFKDTPYNKAHKSKSEIACNWAPNGGFLVCDQIIHSTTGTKNDLGIYTYNKKAQAFSFFGLARDVTEARTTKLTIEGNLWTYLDEADDGGKHIRFRTTNKFTSPRTMIWRSEYSEDGIRWILMGEGTDTRLPGP